MTALGMIQRLSAATLVLVGVIVMTTHVRADWLDGDAGADPWDRCAQCHGLFGAGNRIKFPRLAGQDPYYIMKELHDFRHGLRTNDGGQMQKTATEVKKNDIPRVAKYFAAQTPPWPKQTIAAKVESRPRPHAGDRRHPPPGGLPGLP